MTGAQSKADEVALLISELGTELFQAYLEQAIPAVLRRLQPDRYTVSNAAAWIELEPFYSWLERELQKRAPTASSVIGASSRHPESTPSPVSHPPVGPLTLLPAPLVAAPSQPPSTRAGSLTSSSTDGCFPVKVAALDGSTTSGARNDDAEDSEVEDSTVVPPKRKRLSSRRASSDIISLLTSDSEDETATARSSKRPKPNTSNVLVKITKFQSCSHLVTTSKLEPCWAVPRDNSAYLLDLRDDGRVWNDSKGVAKSMASILKSQDMDAWGGGTGGSTNPKKCPNVIALGDVKCQYAEHTCEGIWVCCHIDKALLGDGRYEPDNDARDRLLQRVREINAQQYSTIESAAISFYYDAINDICPAVDSLGERCKGLAVLRALKKKNLDGKKYFIGCEHYERGSREHRFITLPASVDEAMVKELFQNQGALSRAVPQAVVRAGQCAWNLPPRQGGRC